MREIIYFGLIKRGGKRIIGAPASFSECFCCKPLRQVFPLFNLKKEAEEAANEYSDYIGHKVEVIKVKLTPN